MNRRIFLKQTSFSAALGFFNQLPLHDMLPADILHLTIMHTNDVHSRIDPFPEDGSRNAGQGGVARRKILIDSIRNEGHASLLLDAGDIFQGTPYFNLFKGEIEMKAMSHLGYDAATIGNHDFDGGLENYVKQLQYVNFPMVISNYDFTNTALNGKTSDYKIWKYDGLKIGMYGLGIELEGLVPKELYLETQYLDPVKIARQYERLLKKELKCDYVICLSHLGYKYKEEYVSDVVIAQKTEDTDLIIGGHTHTFMREPHVEKNAKGEPVIVNQVGFAGIYLGRIDLFFEKGGSKRSMSGENIHVKS